MATIDWVIIILLALGAVSGFMKGFFKQLAAVVGLIAGLLVARALFAGLGEQLAVAVGIRDSFCDIRADTGFSVDRFDSTFGVVSFGFCLDENRGYDRIRFYQPPFGGSAWSDKICACNQPGHPFY